MMSMHERLMLVKGIAPSRGDTNSAEVGLETIDFMNPKGFMLDSWEPQVSGMKNSGVWADSQTMPGRRLIAGQDGNVLETIRLVIQRGDYESFYNMITRLQRFIRECREMWTTFHQIEPVYLLWKAVLAPEEQYARIYSIDIDTGFDDEAQSPEASITVAIEREPYWNAFPPGANPKLWALRGVNYGLANLSLIGGERHLGYTAALANRFEYLVSNYSIIARNYIDIPAASIPGDAPALVEFTLQYTTSPTILVNQVHVARSTKITSAYNLIANAVVPAAIILPAPVGQSSADASNVADTGGVYGDTGVPGGKLRKRISFAGVTAHQNRILWFGNTGSNGVLLRGKYAVYARARQLNGSSGDVSMGIRFEFGGAGGIFADLRATPTVSGTSGNTVAWPLTYFGTITIPLNTRNEITPDGYGITEDPILSISLQAGRSTGSAELYVCDLILIPFDEISCLLTSSVGFIATSIGAWYDNTGYATHGDNTPFASSYIVTGGLTQTYAPLELRGQEILLEPNTNNRLYFLFAGTSGGIGNLSDPNSDFTLRLNIIPRWRGIRDV